jgi:uroporphyrinogen decarboxylase
MMWLQERTSNLNSRERMLAAINHEPVDRIPTDIWATGEVWDCLRAAYGDEPAVRAALHIDGMASPGPEYIGPLLPSMPSGETVNEWGMRKRNITYATGSYDEQYFYPLASAQTMEDLDAYAWPKADWYDYSKMREQAQEMGREQVVMCGYMAPFFYHNMLRGLELSLMDPHDDPDFTNAILDGICTFFLEYHQRCFEACDGLIDIAQVTDDYGAQYGPMISLDTFRTIYQPRLRQFIDLCHGFGIKVFHHDDGAARIFLPDLVEMGIDILNPVQHTCPGMEMGGLKQDFGEKICFHGAIDNQYVLPMGSEEEVRAEVRDCIDKLASDGTGYILAPCHNLQPVSPMENIVAMYDEAYNYGRF